MLCINLRVLFIPQAVVVPLNILPLTCPTPTGFPAGNHELVLCVCESVCFGTFIHLIFFFRFYSCRVCISISILLSTVF